MLVISTHRNAPGSNIPWQKTPRQCENEEVLWSGVFWQIAIRSIVELTFGSKYTDLNSSLKERQLQKSFFWERVYLHCIEFFSWRNLCFSKPCQGYMTLQTWLPYCEWLHYFITAHIQTFHGETCVFFTPCQGYMTLQTWLPYCEWLHYFITAHIQTYLYTNHLSLYILACQAHPASVKQVQCWSVFFEF